jgi:hypothetical protein
VLDGVADGLDAGISFAHDFAFCFRAQGGATGYICGFTATDWGYTQVEVDASGQRFNTPFDVIALPALTDYKWHRIEWSAGNATLYVDGNPYTSSQLTGKTWPNYNANIGCANNANTGHSNYMACEIISGYTYSLIGAPKDGKGLIPYYRHRAVKQGDAPTMLDGYTGAETTLITSYLLPTTDVDRVVYTTNSDADANQDVLAVDNGFIKMPTLRIRFSPTLIEIHDAITGGVLAQVSKPHGVHTIDMGADAIYVDGALIAQGATFYAPEIFSPTGYVTSGYWGNGVVNWRQLVGYKSGKVAYIIVIRINSAGHGTPYDLVSHRFLQPTTISAS